MLSFSSFLKCFFIALLSSKFCELCYYYETIDEASFSSKMRIEITGPIKRTKIFDSEKDDSEVKIVVPGAFIINRTDFMSGHGTFYEKNKIVASVARAVRHVNKLLTVQPFKSRYSPDVGDFIVGRVVEVNQKGWKIDINSIPEGLLNLANISLPGDELRRKSAEDEMRMRLNMEEGDLVAAEVLTIQSDNSTQLQARTLYGKLGQNLFVKTFDIVQFVSEVIKFLSHPSITEIERPKRSVIETTTSWFNYKLTLYEMVMVSLTSLMIIIIILGFCVTVDICCFKRRADGRFNWSNVENEVDAAKSKKRLEDFKNVLDKVDDELKAADFPSTIESFKVSVKRIENEIEESDKLTTQMKGNLAAKTNNNMAPQIPVAHN